MKEDTEHQACGTADDGEDNIFTVQVGIDLPVEKPEYLDGGEFTGTLGNVDIGQIV